LKLLAVDKLRGWARLAITNNMDLVNLHRLIRPGDVVYQETSREVKKERASGEVDSERVSLKIGIAVEKKSVDPLMKRIRFQGKIVFTDRDLDILKKYHTIQVSRGDVIEIESRERLPYLLRLGEEGEERVREMVVISGDDEELALVKIDVDGIKVLKTWKVDGGSKRIGYNVEEQREKVFDELVQQLKELTSKSKPKLVLMGTTVHADIIANEIKSRDVRLSNLISRRIQVNVGGVDGIREALRRGVLGEELKPLADAIQVEKAMSAILKHPEHIHMGLEEVARACRASRGALVLATEDFIWENMDNTLLDEILSRAERGIIKFRAILSDTEASDKINSLGGIICLEKKILEG
jgi:protein pelota